MSAAAVAGIVGTGFSIYSGITQGSAAKAARAEAMAAYQRNQQIAETLKTRQEALVDQPLRNRIAELQSTNMTPQGQIALNQFNNTAAGIDRQIQGQAQWP